MTLAVDEGLSPNKQINKQINKQNLINVQTAGYA